VAIGSGEVGKTEPTSGKPKNFACGAAIAHHEPALRQDSVAKRGRT
jgi:hypothetical protein